MTPLPVQYVRFLKGALVGDFGTSYYYNEPAMSVVLERAPATLTLACAALLISVVLGIPAGIVAAVKRNSVSDAVIRVLALLGQCMPAFWLGIMLIMLFAVKLGWMPTGGAEDGLRSLILPAFTLGVFSAATICRLLRSNLIEVLGKEYIDVAKAKGLPKSKIIGKHALKNAMSSIITILGMQFALCWAARSSPSRSSPGRAWDVWSSEHHHQRLCGGGVHRLSDGGDLRGDQLHRGRAVLRDQSPRPAAMRR